MSAANPSARGPAFAASATAGRGNVLASKKPLIMGWIALGLSAVLVIWTAATSSVLPVVGWLSLPLADTDTWLLSFGGYLLTPFATIGAVAWDQVAQRRGLRNRNFGQKPSYSFWLRIIAGAGFVLAIWHVLNLSNVIAGGG